MFLSGKGYEGQIEIRQTSVGAKLFAKVGGKWRSMNLSDDETIRIGPNSKDHIRLDQNGLKLFKSSTVIAEFGSTLYLGDQTTEHVKLTSSSMEMKDGSTTMMSLADGDISMKGKIRVTSVGSQNVCMGAWFEEDVPAASGITATEENPDVSGANYNVLLGFQAGKSIASGDNYNVCIGHYAGSTYEGVSGCFVGNSAGLIATGAGNTCIGSGAGDLIVAGANNTCIGKSARTGNASWNNVIAIGKDATGQGTNTATIGNDDITTVYMGEDAQATLRCAKIGIVETTPGVELDVAGRIAIGNKTELTISSGVIPITQSYHLVDTEGDASSDDLDTINGGVTGTILVLQAADSGRTVTVTENGNILLYSTSNDLNHVDDTITLIYNGSKWQELARGNNA